MTVALDASSPALATTPIATSVTTAAFNPPSSTLLVATAISIDAPTSITNNGTALTWTLRKRSAADSVSIYTAPLPTGRTGMTVTANWGGTLGRSLKVDVFTGADLSVPIGADGTGASSTNAVTVTGYTSTNAGSRGVCGAYDSNTLGTPSSTDDEVAASNGAMRVVKATNTATAGTAVTFNLDAAGAGTPAWSWAAVEIRNGVVDATVPVPSNVVATTAIPAPALSTGSTVTPSPVAATVTIPDPSPSGGATVAPGVISATTVIAQPVLATGGNVTVGVDPIAAVATVPLPAFRTDSTVTPGAVAAVATVPLPHIQLPEHVNVSPAPLAVAVAIPPPVISTPILPGAGIDRPGQIEYGGFLIGSGTPYKFGTLSGFDDLPPGDDGSVVNPDDHGWTPGQIYAGQRVLTFTGTMKALPEEFEDVRDALIAATPYPKGSADLPLAIRILSRTYLVYGKMAPNGRQIIINPAYRVGFARVVLQWICGDPRVYGITLHTATLPNGGSIQAVNAGNTETRPAFRIPGPATNPQVTVVDTGRTMRFGIALAPGEYLDVDCRVGSALWMGTTNVLGSLSAASVPPKLFELPPGVSTLAYTATGSSVPIVNPQWRDATL